MSIFGAFNPVSSSGRQLTRGEINLNNVRAQNAVQNQINGVHEQYQARIRELEIALAVERASEKATIAQRDALKSALKEAAPNHKLFRKTGRKYKNGNDETEFGTIFIKTFDDNLRGKVPGNPKDYRAI
jgi:hypothetical protein